MNLCKRQAGPDRITQAAAVSSLYPIVEAGADLDFYSLVTRSRALFPCASCRRRSTVMCRPIESTGLLMDKPLTADQCANTAKPYPNYDIVCGKRVGRS